MVEDTAGDQRVLDEGDERATSSAAFASKDVEPERAPEQLSPGQIARPSRWGGAYSAASTVVVVALAASMLVAAVESARAGGSSDDVRSPLGVGCEDTVVAELMLARGRHEWGEAGDEVERLEV